MGVRADDRVERYVRLKAYVGFHTALFSLSRASGTKGTESRLLSPTHPAPTAPTVPTRQEMWMKVFRQGMSFFDMLCCNVPFWQMRCVISGSRCNARLNYYKYIYIYKLSLNA